LHSTAQKLTAEFVGTFALCFAGIGAMCADSFLKSGSPNAAGTGLLGIALAHGLAIAVMVNSLGHISGGHFNPAITIGFWVSKKIGTGMTLLYWAAQLAGAGAASLLLTVILPRDLWRAPGLMLGVPALGTGIDNVHAMVLEAALTFLLVWVVFATTVDEKSSFRSTAGFSIGLTIAIGILVGGPLSGAAMNPARAFGPVLITGMWKDHGVHWVGPLFGGALAAATYSSVFLRPVFRSPE